MYLAALLSASTEVLEGVARGLRVLAALVVEGDLATTLLTVLQGDRAPVQSQQAAT